MLRKYRKRVAQYFNYLVLIMITFLGIAIVNRLVQKFNVEKLGDFSSNQFLTLFNVIILVGFIIFVCSKIFSNLAGKIYNALTQYGQGFAFLITKGDKKRQEEIRECDKKSAKNIITKFIFSLIFNVACGIIASLLI